MWDCFNLLQDKLLIQRMQMWQTTQLAPGTSFCFCFPFAMHFSVLECHLKRVKSSIAEKVFFFQFTSLHLTGNQKDGG